MYKAAARNLLRKKRPSPMLRVRPEPRTRAQLRVFWFPVVRHHVDANISVADKYGPKFPTWLEREVDRLTPARWLTLWDEKTGRPVAAPAAASSRPAPRLPAAPRSARRRKPSCR